MRVAFVSLLAAACLGCGEASAPADTPDAPIAPGEYIAAISAEMAPTAPFLFAAELDADGALTLQPLASGGTRVGDALTTTLPDDDGQPVLDGLRLQLTIPFEALPQWSRLYPPPAELDVTLQTDRSSCGAVSGLLYFPMTLPFGLEGSTFALQPASVPDATTSPVVDCDGTHAQPLP